MRRAGETDAELIAELHVANWRTTYRRELPASFLETQDVGAWAAAWRERIRKGVDVLLAEDGTELAGFVACGPAQGRAGDSGAWQIYNLHVRPRWQRRGIGGELFRAALEIARAQGAHELVLWVVDSNSNARTFYEGKGMECDGERQEHPVGGDCCLQEIRYRMRL